MDRIGPYKVVRRLTSEGTGELYEAVHEQIQRRASIKVLHKELAEDRAAVTRFLNEAKAVNLISHPSIVTIYEQGQLDSGAPYIVMEYLEGETLRDRLRRLGRPMDPAKAMRTARQLASALSAAHAKQVVHRDLKPSSIVLISDADTPDGERVKVANFGIAKLMTTNNASVLTMAGVSMGTPTYMSPEQCRNARESTDRSDIYSLGVIMYEMLSGTPPFSDAEGAVRLMMAHMQQDPPPLANRAPEASAELCALVHRMLAKAPETRPSAADVHALLTRMSGGYSTANLPIPDLQDISKPPAPSPTMMMGAPPVPEKQPSALAELFESKTGRMIAIGAGIAVLLGIIGIIAAVRGLLSGPPPPPPQITWTISSEPSEADVADSSGQVIGHTPWSQTQQIGKGLATLTIRKKGFHEESVVLDREKDGSQKVTLAADPVQKVEPATPPTPTVQEAAQPEASPQTKSQSKSKNKSKKQRPEKKQKKAKKGKAAGGKKKGG